MTAKSAKILVARHATYRHLSMPGVETPVEILSRDGIKMAQALLKRLQAEIPGYNALNVMAVSSPSPRAAQTAEILTGEARLVLKPGIGPAYPGVPQFVEELQALRDYFEMIVVVTHAPPVGMIAAAFAGTDATDEGSPYHYRNIDLCTGFMIDGDTVRKF